MLKRRPTRVELSKADIDEFDALQEALAENNNNNDSNNELTPKNNNNNNNKVDRRESNVNKKTTKERILGKN
eukprot:TRINITY_DN56192_c0_g1_i2.p1 TRINITY_DN56192_c0_g1~~TRINITY_DN56192_c0_g1_i2.p1  ORF type:complete len:72 (-),score=25.51 TRINITY_DN56192_c0_g1_i2:50-265(-)